MSGLSPRETRRFNAQPIETVDYTFDVDYVGDGIRQHRLDVIVPHDHEGPLPVYVYFHGGGWTSGDKSALTRYCASQALGGMVVVNVNYRTAPRVGMRQMLEDANAAVAWIASHIVDFGGDPERVILGGDSAGGQISALLAAASSQPEFARHYELSPALASRVIRGVVQHCSAVDFSVIFERGFILGLGFVRMLLPRLLPGETLKGAARFLSPIEWLGSAYPPVFVTTSRRDYFYRANLNFIAALRRHRVHVDSLVHDEAVHTWQQDTRHPASEEVYRRLHDFVRRVAPVRVML
jgi:acetyl esterase/lipase